MSKKHEEDKPVDNFVGHYVKETGYAFGKTPLKMPGAPPLPVLDEAPLGSLVEHGQAAAAADLPKCAVLICPSAADPRWYARNVNDQPVMICDGHEPLPQPSEVAVRPPDLTAKDLRADRIVNGYSPTPAEVERVAHALVVAHEELDELRDLADLVNDADITALPPELLAVKQRWLSERYAKETGRTSRTSASACRKSARPRDIDMADATEAELVAYVAHHPDMKRWKFALALARAGGHMPGSGAGPGPQQPVQPVRSCEGYVYFADQGIEVCETCGGCTCCDHVDVDHRKARYRCLLDREGTRCLIGGNPKSKLNHDCKRDQP